MAFTKFLRGLACLAALPCTLATQLGINDQVQPNIDYGTFQNPAAFVRPRFRYWVNDASVDLKIMAEDIKAIGKAGGGGIQLLGYYLYGDSSNFGGQLLAPLQSDWTIYGFGTPAWKDLLGAALTATKENNLVIDLAMGPNQGAGVPAPYNDTGLLWDLAPFNVTVPIGGTYDDVLPGWGTGKLVAAVAGVVLESTNSTSGAERILQNSSLTDITSKVSCSGRLKYQFPSALGQENVLFAYYLAHSEYREVQTPAAAEAAVPQSPVTNYIQNGSWAVDHFSAAGAQVVMDLWNEALLDGNMKSIINEVGNYMWEDSMEMSTAIWWTPNLPSAFQRNRGYSVIKYLPLLFDTLPAYITDENDAGSDHITDYKQTLTELYQEYLGALTEWSNSLGIQFSSQVSYNLLMDMLSSVPHVNAPEDETLGFSNNLDAYRQFSGPANLAGKRVISNEGGAVMNEAYQHLIPDMLWSFKRAFAISNNNFIVHGYPHSGNYGNTSWPGFTTFSYLFSDMHGPRQPAFIHYSDWLGWLSRTQFISQTGVPKIDLAFWSKSMNSKPGTLYESDDLALAGYTYEFLSPDNFGLPEAYVSSGVLAPKRQAFKALIVNSTSSLTSFGVHKLVEYAEAGLPIIFAGGIPSTFSGYNPSTTESAADRVQQLTNLSNVQVVSYNGLANSLKSLNIIPRTSVSSNGTWYTYWRTNDADATIYTYIFNDAPNIPAGEGYTKGSITFATTGMPYLYDAWSGSVVPIYVYSQTDSTTTIPLELAGNQTIIIGFQKAAPSHLHLEDVTTGIISVSANDSSITIYRSFDTEKRSVKLSNGKSASLEPMSVPAFILSNWTLVVESWTAPADFYNVESSVTKENITFSTQTLEPWTSISSTLTNVSGLGYYSTYFTWPPPSSGSVSGAILDLGPIQHTARVSINGKELPPLDLTAAKSDIGSLLYSGINKVEVVVSTTLGNVLRNYWDELVTCAKLASAVAGDPPGEAEYGLLHPVQIIPYRKDVLS